MAEERALGAAAAGTPGRRARTFSWTILSPRAPRCKVVEGGSQFYVFLCPRDFVCLFFFFLYSSLALSVSLIYPTTFLSLVFFPKLISCSQHDHTSPVFPCDYSPLGILQVILLIYCSWRHTFCRLEIYPQRDIKGLGRLNVIFYLLVFYPLISAFLSRTFFFHNYCFLVLWFFFFFYHGATKSDCYLFFLRFFDFRKKGHLFLVFLVNFSM